MVLWVIHRTLWFKKVFRTFLHEIILLMEEVLHHLGCHVNHGIFTISTGAGFLPSTVFHLPTSKFLNCQRLCWKDFGEIFDLQPQTLPASLVSGTFPHGYSSPLFTDIISPPPLPPTENKSPNKTTKVEPLKTGIYISIPPSKQRPHQKNLH